MFNEIILLRERRCYEGEINQHLTRYENNTFEAGSKVEKKFRVITFFEVKQIAVAPQSRKNATKCISIRQQIINDLTCHDNNLYFLPRLHFALHA